MGWRAPEPDEYTLTVEYDSDRRTHTFRLLRGGELLPPMESAPLVGTREQVLSGLNEVMNELARNKPRYDYAQARDWLEGKGAQMFRQLLPKELQQVLWEARHRMARLNIIAPGGQLPWEMLFLMDPDPAPDSTDPGLFLADATVVVRWLYGEGAPALIQRAPAYVVIPANSPPSAQQEQASVAMVCGPPTLVSDLNGLRDLTRNGTFRWLHFASHNITLPGQFGTSYIPFGNSPFSQELMESIPARRYAANRPLVFMNACTTAGAQPLFTETTGWADTFLKRGAAAFVGSLWEVRDQSAAAFAHAFYQALKEGRNLGNALRAARAALDPGDPTYLAYALYGNPRATLQ
ncbi:CHAT domain-containing protein (plasmid) [Hymenobacter sp. 5317J-9]|uniref:CHAT domain-containing protein n=1 Tax=Hymenobacter sp. 5317J-9 TaxID=2932250 RepID=UPI001FD6E976|nr:CHAT domain-containing protein [Hymenobacter sp. 5317J-9]UOR00220.1 CHAT domain-containing protein [Hymenobacter sp. 5317J-9]